MFFTKTSRRSLIRRREQKKRHIKRYFLLTISLLLIIGLVYFVLKSVYFKINTLEYNINNVNCASEDEIKNNVFVGGKNIFLIDENSITKRLKAKFECIQEVKIKKSYPQKLIISLSGRNPVLVLTVFHQSEASSSASLADMLQQVSSPSTVASDSAKPDDKLSGDSFLVDSEGNVFALGQKKELPNIKVLNSDISIGKNLGKELTNRLLMINDKLKTLDINVEEFKLYFQDNILIRSDKLILLSNNSDVQKQLASLQLILEKTKIENGIISLIDLRFDKPVVRYVKKKN